MAVSRPTQTALSPSKECFTPHPWPPPPYNVAWLLPIFNATRKTTTTNKASPDLPFPRRSPLRPQHLRPPATRRPPENPCPAIPQLHSPACPPLFTLLSSSDRLSLARNPTLCAPDWFWISTLLLELEHAEAEGSSETATRFYQGSQSEFGRWHYSKHKVEFCAAAALELRESAYGSGSEGVCWVLDDACYCDQGAV